MSLFFAQFALTTILMMVVFILNIILAVAVYLDAERQIARQRPLFFFGSGFWTIVVLVTGLLGLAVYWAMHHSTLRPPSNDS